MFARFLDLILAMVVLWVISLALAGCCNPFQPVQEDPAIPATPEQRTIFQMVERMNWVVTASILAVGAGFFAFLNGNGVGIKIMAAALVVLSLIIMVARHSVWFALAATVTSVGFLAYTILIKNQALEEIISGVERVKNRLAVTHPEIIPDVKNDLGTVESATTERIVEAIKA